MALVRYVLVAIALLRSSQLTSQSVLLELDAGSSDEGPTETETEKTTLHREQPTSFSFQAEDALDWGEAVRVVTRERDSDDWPEQVRASPERLQERYFVCRQEQQTQEREKVEEGMFSAVLEFFHPQKQPSGGPGHCQAGTECRLECSTTFSTGDNLSLGGGAKAEEWQVPEAPVVTFRLRGPALLDCSAAVSVHPIVEDERMASATYRLGCFIREVGQYSLEGSVMYESEAVALQTLLPPESMCAVPPIGTTFSVPGINVVAPGIPERREGRGGRSSDGDGDGGYTGGGGHEGEGGGSHPPLCSPADLARSGGSGRWVPKPRNADGTEGGEKAVIEAQDKFVWQPWSCHLEAIAFPYNSTTSDGGGGGGGGGGRGRGGRRRLRTASSSTGTSTEGRSKKKRPLLFIGDSHQREMVAFLHRYTDLKVVYEWGTGWTNHLPGKWDQSRPSCDKDVTVLDFEDGKDGVIFAFLEEMKREQKAKEAGRWTEEEAPWIIIESGQWDLRDSSVEHYLYWFHHIAQHIKELPPDVQSRIVVRTAPSWAYNLFQGREFRTNTKLRLAAEGVRRIVAEQLPLVRLLDSFAITSPRFEDSCDTHHYICEEKPSLEVATVQVLLHMLELV